ncbi:hypothetical protein BCR34DRAFT_674552 [Clohesyomyces aquaticus]|uniref:2,6-dihydroxypyridine 3-monooxygenase substrate binding domain-containing protein n=1 Tax=Clohesyomyces aquaticus TaxID=1231657 RepID=A0A1Y1ZH40_9PLEO|nr:hypothetical protein BCR34DRAFT_674552 [Clohesyomyces aquaticus]
MGSGDFIAGSQFHKKRHPMRIIVIGGSISSLMCGIATKHASHDVQILEGDGDKRQSHMAGICLGRDFLQFLNRHDRIADSFTLHSDRIQVLNQQAKALLLVKTERNITMWDALYYRLRAIFDGYASSYYPVAPHAMAADGPAIYKSKSRVLDVRNDDDRNGMVVTYEDVNSRRMNSIPADLVVGADGPSSFIRGKYLPHCQENYCGFVPESAVSKETVQAFSKNVNVFMKNRSHCLTYIVPGPHGSLRSGERFLNFAWYINQTPAEVDTIMRDSKTGRLHHRTVPSGHVDPSLWTKQRRIAQNTPMPAPFLDVINDVQGRKAVFEDGKIVLIGDGLSSLRPHTAFSASQAAFHVLTLEDTIAQQGDLREWESRVLRFGYLHSVQSWWFSNFYQSDYLTAAVSAVWYWAMRFGDSAGSWWVGEQRVLRES